MLNYLKATEPERIKELEHLIEEYQNILQITPRKEPDYEHYVILYQEAKLEFKERTGYPYEYFHPERQEIKLL